MNIKELFYENEVKQWFGYSEAEVTGIAVDTRRLANSNVFVAIRGEKADGHNYIAKAVENGANILIVEDTAKCGEYISNKKITIAVVENTKAALHNIVNRFWGSPAKNLKLIGVTATNGKTSTTTILEYILRKMGKKTALIGTIQDTINGKPSGVEKTTITTPDCIELAQILKLARDAEVEYVVMEVSSMALKNERVRSYFFEVGAFLNLSPEHLDNHGTMEDYFESKMKLFSQCRKSVVGMDDARGKQVLEIAPNAITFGTKDCDTVDVSAKNLVYHADHVQFEFSDGDLNQTVRVTPPSHFGVLNALAALAIVKQLGLDMEEAVKYVQETIEIDGRFNVLKLKNGVSVCIDFAHTANALENLLTATRKNTAYQRVISVFGCGGDRDRTKRKPMGSIGEKHSDFVVITSDNPRTEDPLAICEEVFSGVENKEKAIMIPDRREAIGYALDIAKAGDVIVIAGKGHETDQEINGIKYHFNDAEEVLNWEKQHEGL